MEQKYFNTWEFNRILSLIDTNPEQAKIKFEDYLQKYPKDYSAYPYYASVLITMREFDNAEKILKHLITIINDDKKINRLLTPQKIEHIKHNFIYTKIKLLAYQEKYQELLELYYRYPNQIQEMNLNHVIFYAKKKVGKINHETKNMHTYLFKQIVKYDEADFIEHIKKHQEKHIDDIDLPTSSYFFDSFPIDKVLEEIKLYIPSEKIICPGFFDNLYIFKYDRCGKKQNKTTDFFKVYCFHNTTNIITIHPTDEHYNIPYVDLNYLAESNEKPKTKRLSQIEKFNQKYNKK